MPINTVISGDNETFWAPLPWNDLVLISVIQVKLSLGSASQLSDFLEVWF